MKPETCTRLLAAQLVLMIVWTAVTAWLFTH
jgi:hypothetical protein